MNIRIYSDLHIEFEEFKAEAKGADAVVLARDTDIGVRGIDWILRQEFDCPVIYAWEIMNIINIESFMELRSGLILRYLVMRGRRL